MTVTACTRTRRALERDSCPNQCSNKGTCKQGFCHCELGYFGRDCSRSRAYHPPQLGVDHPVPYGQLKVYMYELPWEVRGRGEAALGDACCGPTTASWPSALHIASSIEEGRAQPAPRPLHCRRRLRWRTTCTGTCTTASTQVGRASADVALRGKCGMRTCADSAPSPLLPAYQHFFSTFSKDWAVRTEDPW